MARRKYQYLGDINLQHGGIFIDTSEFPYVYAVSLTPGEEDYDTGKVQTDVVAGGFYTDLMADDKSLAELYAECEIYDANEYDNLTTAWLIIGHWGIDGGDYYDIWTGESDLAIVRGVNKHLWDCDKISTSDMNVV